MVRRQGTGQAVDIELLRLETGKAIVEEERLHQRYTEHTREVERWRQRTTLAIAKGYEELARQALERQRQHQALAEEYKREYDAQQEHVSRLKHRWLHAERSREAGANTPTLLTSRSAQRERTIDLIAALELDADPLAERLAAMEHAERVDQQLSAIKARLASKRAEGA